MGWVRYDLNEYVCSKLFCRTSTRERTSRGEQRRREEEEGAVFRLAVFRRKRVSERKRKKGGLREGSGG